MDSDCLKYVWKNYYYLSWNFEWPVQFCWTVSQAGSEWVPIVDSISSSMQCLQTGKNNPTSKYLSREDCFRSVNSEDINYSLNVLTLMSAATLTTLQVQCRDTLLCLFLAPRVLCSEGRRVYFSCSLLQQASVFSGLGGKEKCHHLLLGISQQVLSLSSFLAASRSIPLEKSGDNARLSGRGGGGEMGVCNPK